VNENKRLANFARGARKNAQVLG